MQVRGITQGEVNMKINTLRIEELSEVLSTIQHGCSARLFSTADITTAAKTAEEKLAEIGVPIAYRKGCRVSLSPSKPANSYRGIPEGTHIELIKGSKDWFMIRCCRGRVSTAPYGRNEKTQLSLTDEAKASMPSTYEL